jgi:methionyl-tRNA formyltransferase
VIHVLCSDVKHPVYPLLDEWCCENHYGLFNDPSGLTGGEVLFLISCTVLITEEVRNLYKKTWVIHESDLPKGRGWSPLAWQIVQGSNDITVSIIKAEEKIDSGGILKKKTLKLEGHELYDEIQKKLFNLKKELMEYALENDDTEEQSGIATYYRRRTPEDSRIDTGESIASQFNLLRICEPRFPAFFYMNGRKYEITIRKA